LSPRARRTRLIVSVVTAIGLVAQIVAGLTTRSDAWPIAGFPMYAGARSTWTRLDVTVTTRDGEARTLKASDLHVAGLDLHLWERRHLGVSADDDVEGDPAAALAQLAAAYNRHHRNDPAVRLRYEVTAGPVEDPVGGAVEHTLTWEGR